MSQLSLLLASAQHGDEAAWRSLAARYEPMLREVARGLRLAPTQVDDVVQNTWLRLFTHLGAIRQAEALGGWLATTARRECLHLLKDRVREVLTDDPAFAEHPVTETPETAVLAAERRAVVGRAVAALPERRRELMRALAAEEDYHEISARLAIPVGSIGPTRARSLEQLRGNRELLALHRAA